MNKIKIFPLLLIFAFIFNSCENDTDDLNKTHVPNQGVISENIDSSKDDVINTKEGIKLIIPKGAISEDASVTIGHLNNVDSKVISENYEQIGQSIFLNISTNKLNKDIYIEVDKPADYEKDKTIITAFDGISYFPLLYKDNGEKLLISVDELNWNNTSDFQSKSLSHVINGLVIDFLKYNQEPSKYIIGLKEVNYFFGNMYLSDIKDIDKKGKYIVLLHGLASDPYTWDKFLSEYISKSKAGYKILTYGYVSSNSIDDNAKQFSETIKNLFKNKNARLELIGHSMGGLLSRSAIENYGLESYVDNLITLGTPHLGTPFTSYRYLFSEWLTITEDSESFMKYDEATKGITDLDSNSEFIAKLNSNPASSVQYYAIAAVNNPFNFMFGLRWSPSVEPKYSDNTKNELLEGDDDGVVTTKSALGIKRGKDNKFKTVYIDHYMAHTKILTDLEVINAIVEHLDNKYYNLFN